MGTGEHVVSARVGRCEEADQGKSVDGTGRELLRGRDPRRHMSR